MSFTVFFKPKGIWFGGKMVAHIKGAGPRKAKYNNFDRPKGEWATILYILTYLKLDEKRCLQKTVHLT